MHTQCGQRATIVTIGGSRRTQYKTSCMCANPSSMKGASQLVARGAQNHLAL